MQRRHFIAGLTAMSAVPITLNLAHAQEAIAPMSDPDVLLYAGIHGEAFEIPPVDVRLIRPGYRRQLTDYTTTERPGTIVVDTAHRYLYLVAEGGKAMRYGVGIGREGFTWSGRGEIRLKREWPTWTPPSEMIVRQPELEPYRNGMAPGLDNPLGARALYIFQDGRDTLYRVHGTSDPTTIGLAVSSGCVRLINQDVVDLYNRVAVGSAIVVQQTA
jgi:lipoprotein-anchoring transpeptidase ErfK/SrfK|tara:strand:- start:8123 stop:8770 length:648 start_codon:yes stop_codon:yes gene_type:complete